uniref:proteasome endopeptidase complex n=1 Tax=Sinocyclocheilus anshuiensis TaxID=1608454 RepID=A0A671KPJ0_9TELE
RGLFFKCSFQSSTLHQLTSRYLTINGKWLFRMFVVSWTPLIRKNRVPTLFSSTFSSLSPHQQPFHCKGLICCPISQKIMPIHSHLVVNISGSGADCMLWERILTCEMRLYQLRHRKRLSVNGAAKLLSMMLHPFKAVSDQNTKNVLSTFGGRSGPRVCYVCSDGLQLKGEMISVGSGSPYAYAVLDDGWRWGMTVDEAVALAREAVFRATHWDAYSGNNVDLFHITAHGWRRRDREDLKEEGRKYVFINCISTKKLNSRQYNAFFQINICNHRLNKLDFP